MYTVGETPNPEDRAEDPDEVCTLFNIRSKREPITVDVVANGKNLSLGLTRELQLLS